jgi:hypothetical protein
MCLRWIPECGSIYRCTLDINNKTGLCCVFAPVMEVFAGYHHDHYTSNVYCRSISQEATRYDQKSWLHPEATATFRLHGYVWKIQLHLEDTPAIGRYGYVRKTQLRVEDTATSWRKIPWHCSSGKHMPWRSSSRCRVPWRAASGLRRLCPKALVRLVYPDTLNVILLFPDVYYDGKNRYAGNSEVIPLSTSQLSQPLANYYLINPIHTSHCHQVFLYSSAFRWMAYKVFLFSWKEYCMSNIDSRRPTSTSGTQVSWKTFPFTISSGFQWPLWTYIQCGIPDVIFRSWKLKLTCYLTEQ